MSMQITIESTGLTTHIEGVPVRLWEGVTEAGVRCKVFVHRVAVHNDEDSAQFERELDEKLPPGVVVDLRSVL
jgi:hypothetical protein